ncbi:PREDICTED: uncharacterized protein LOC104700188 [Camelina sativa]|uniref:Uncharacterized protein LOC104700188 n=1 Tax=Camelina sativa TaxID=90675 RepID=A0ABM0SNV3_CAMSA|nr:PREDICTED: uncharacterized protein LOC104700188 [Camelina sativa]XP_010413962.1 PREDICTED: uncharacterized protein LOC104700188 [Camelina sativa]XP_010413963.1 PREDICTED: uncharacterized protein LOC104700188 [Camelina sativa]
MVTKEESVVESTCVQHANLVLQHQVPISSLEHSLNFCKPTLDVCEELSYTFAMVGIDQVQFQSGFECVKGKDSAHHMFDRMLLRGYKSQQRKKLSLFPKFWKFKYKEVKLLRLLPQTEHYNLRGGMIIKQLHENSPVYYGVDQKTGYELDMFGWDYMKRVTPDYSKVKGMCEVTEFEGIKSRGKFTGFVLVVADCYEQPTGGKNGADHGCSNSEKLRTKKNTNLVKSWMFKFRKKKSGEGHGEQSVHDRIILVQEQLLQTSLFIQGLMQNRKTKFLKHWLFRSDCFKKDDLLYHETLQIWPFIRFKFWKFKFLNRNLQKTGLPIEKDMGNQDEMFIVMSVFLLLNGMDHSFSDKVLIQLLEWGDCAEDWTQKMSVVICFILRKYLHLSFDCEEHVLARPKRNHGLSLGLQTRCFTHYAATGDVQKIVGNVAPNVERFQIKHKWRFKLLPSILELNIECGVVYNYKNQLISIAFKWSIQWQFPCQISSPFTTKP